jgi:hypothetical protein
MRNLTGNFTITLWQSGILSAVGAFYVRQRNIAIGDDGEAPALESHNIGFDASLQVPTAVENRPINMAVNWFIKY